MGSRGTEAGKQASALLCSNELLAVLRLCLIGLIEERIERMTQGIGSLVCCQLPTEVAVRQVTLVVSSGMGGVPSPTC